MKLEALKGRDSVLIADDFCDYANVIRDFAKGIDFSPREYKGHVYNGIGMADIDMSEYLSEAVGWPVAQELSFFRLGVDGDALTSYIHCDSVCSRFACVWYLTPADLCRGGTGFWRHKELGWDRLPAEGVGPQMAEKLNQDGNIENRWALEALAKMWWNRAVIYPSALFHSRYPRQAFGSDASDGRLIWCCFFDEADHG